MDDDRRRRGFRAASSLMDIASGRRKAHVGPIARAGLIGLVLAPLPLDAAGAQPAGRNRSCAQALIGTTSDDRQLTDLAPPARISTDIQTYGDAPFARQHYARRRNRGSLATATECRSSVDREERAKTYYKDSPAYLSSPQVVAGDGRDRILPRVTVLPWIVDSILNPSD